MADGDCGIGFQQHHGHGFAKNGAATHHYGMFAFQFHLVVLQQAHDAFGGGAAVSVLTHAHATKPEAGDAVHVLFQADGVETGAFINLGGHRMLQQNAVHIRIGVEFVNFCQQLFGAGVFVQLNGDRFHADTLAGVAFHLYIGGRCRVSTHQNGGKNRRAAVGLGFQGVDAQAHLLFELLGQGFAIKNLGGHVGGLSEIDYNRGRLGAVAVIAACRG